MSKNGSSQNSTSQRCAPDRATLHFESGESIRRLYGNIAADQCCPNVKADVWNLTTALHSIMAQQTKCLLLRLMLKAPFLMQRTRLGGSSPRECGARGFSISCFLHNKLYADDQISFALLSRS